MKHFLRNTLFPLFLIVASPSGALLMWHTNVACQGSLTRLWQEFATTGFFSTLYHMWHPVFWGTATAWKIIAIFMLGQLVLMRCIPGRRFSGPLTPNGNTPIYNSNGMSCYLISIILFLVLSYGLGWFSPTIIYDNFPGIIGALNIFSLIFCLLLYVKGRWMPSSTDNSHSGNFIFDYYWGTELYPRIAGWDVKLFTNCRIGMMSWALIIVSFAAKQQELYGLTNTMMISVAIMLVYISKFFWWESGYLRSLDIMHDRAGFYICWGCLVWVPAVYTSPALYLVNHPYQLPMLDAIVILILGVASVMINYFADAQRQKVRATQGNCRVWGQEPVLIHTEYETHRGELKKSILLASGWWGLSRHFHYIPEILAAFLWTLPAMFVNFLPYFYVVFLSILLLHRSIRDEQRCSRKYGQYWQAYCQLVPNRILPRLSFSLFKINRPSSE